MAMRHRRRVRYSRAACWFAVLVFGFTAGAAVVLVTDPGSSASTLPVVPHDHAADNAAGASGSLVATQDHTHTSSAANPADDKGFTDLSNGHHHAFVWHDLDPVTQAEVDRQLDLTRQAAARLPTLADAAAAGYRPAGPYGPGAGIHYIGGIGGTVTEDGSLTDAALLNPGTLLYDGTGPDAKLAGLMYSVDTAIEPVGFVGTNDVWHDHTGLCIVISDKGITTALSDETNMAVKERQCPLVGGRYIKQTGWMMHVWTAPGYENPPGGYFAGENPLIACSDGTYYAASAAERAEAHPDNACKSGAPGRPSTATLAAITKNLEQ